MGYASRSTERVRTYSTSRNAEVFCAKPGRKPQKRFDYSPWFLSADRILLLGSFDPKQRGAEIPDPFFSYSEEVYRSSYRLIRDCIIEYLNTADELR